MRQSRMRGLAVLTAALLALLIFSFPAAAQGRQTPPPKNVPSVEPVTLDQVRTVLGTAKDDISGALDVTTGDGETIIAYRYYDVDQENYETDFASELAPKIQLLYKRFKTLDRIRLQVTANVPSEPGLWKPFTEFTIDRKTVTEIHWTGFMARYLLDLVIKNRQS
ncbi:MAG: hypothetical protein ABFD80_08125 [Acidobacteriota bacterium]